MFEDDNPLDPEAASDDALELALQNDAERDADYPVCVRCRVKKVAKPDMLCPSCAEFVTWVGEREVEIPPEPLGTYEGSMVYLLQTGDWEDTYTYAILLGAPSAPISALRRVFDARYPLLSAIDEAEHLRSVARLAEIGVTVSDGSDADNQAFADWLVATKGFVACDWVTYSV